MGERGSRNVSSEGRLRDIEDQLDRLEQLVKSGQLSTEQSIRELKQILQSAATVIAISRGRGGGKV